MNMLYSVCRDARGRISVYSLGGRSRREERRYAKYLGYRVLHVTASWDDAHARCRSEITKQEIVSTATRAVQGEPTTPTE